MPRSSISVSRLLLNIARQDRASRANSLLLLALGVTAGVGLVMSFTQRRERRLRRQREPRRELAPARTRPIRLVEGPRIPLEPALPLEAHEALEARVLEVFRHDPILRDRAIDIGALEGDSVELTGWVDAPTEVAHAVTIARGVPGVVHVVDHLAVRGREAPRNHSSDNYAAVRADRPREGDPSTPRAD